MNAIGEPVGQADVVRCQESAAKLDIDSGRIAFCASCNERLCAPVDEIIDAGPIEQLSDGFKYEADHPDLVELLKNNHTVRHSHFPPFSMARNITT
jgi:hypothetical protein